MNRPALISMVHAGAKRMGWDEDTRRAWMEKHACPRSCKDATDAQLSMLVDELRDLGGLTPQPGYGGSGPDRPTQTQWRLMLKLSRDCGLSGAVKDPGLATLCKRIAKIESPRFLDREGMAAIINALNGWKASKAKKVGPSAANPHG